MILSDCSHRVHLYFRNSFTVLCLWSSFWLLPSCLLVFQEFICYVVFMVLFLIAAIVSACISGVRLPHGVHDPHFDCCHHVCFISQVHLLHCVCGPLSDSFHCVCLYFRSSSAVLCSWSCLTVAIESTCISGIRLLCCVCGPLSDCCHRVCLCFTNSPTTLCLWSSFWLPQLCLCVLKEFIYYTVFMILSSCLFCISGVHLLHCVCGPLSDCRHCGCCTCSTCPSHWSRLCE